MYTYMYMYVCVCVYTHTCIHTYAMSVQDLDELSFFSHAFDYFSKSHPALSKELLDGLAVDKASSLQFLLNQGQLPANQRLAQLEEGVRSSVEISRDTDEDSNMASVHSDTHTDRHTDTHTDTHGAPGTQAT
jgi:CRP-like cAMP-binding protein